MYANPELREQLIQKFIDIIGSECTTKCKCNLPSSNVPSLFRKIPIKDMPEFKWSRCLEEVKAHALTFLRRLVSVSSRTDRRNKEKRGDSHSLGICMALACIFKERNREMCGVQTLLSLLLFKSCAEKVHNCQM